ncbi:MAG: glycogen debranching protein GlgX [Candidatus Methylumidiphilus sp.]
MTQPASPNLGLMSFISADFSFERGHPLPLGATVARGGINFAIFSRHASAVTLVLFQPGEAEEMAEFPFDRQCNRTGNIWHAFIAGLDPGIEYAYRIDGPKSPPHRYDPAILLADPYAIALNGCHIWGERGGDHHTVRRALLVTHEYDWGNDQPINRPLAESVIYELHVRGFTRHDSAQVGHPGTFRGIIEKIPYLKQLGVTAVELLPVTEFDELESNRVNPADNTPLHNFWGYHPLSYFALQSGYAADPAPGAEVAEFKDMVKALHAAGIEVILDVVYNHSGEGDHRGPVYSLKGIDNSVYYMLLADGSYMNFSGCGNTVNCNHPFVRNFILDSLRYWVMDMHVDGFRFDLASILGRDQAGHVLANPPLLEQIAGDPILANTKLIAEAWDAAGLYQVGSFPNWGRWAEWNGRFRDDIRSFVRGESGKVGSLATRLAGSADLYQHGREPSHGINFITSHDGFTLRDLVSYDHKHNLANGEDNRDGDNNNLSWNCGAEGPTENPEILALRERQVRNFAVLLLFSRGVPMILAGDEFGRSQQGNNNAYCQDNAISWLDWGQQAQNASLTRFFRLLIAFRKGHGLLLHDSFALQDSHGPRIVWHGVKLGQPDWGPESRSLAMHLSGTTAQGRADDILLIANAHWEAHDFELPKLDGRRWHCFVDTQRPGDEAIAEHWLSRPLDHAHSYRAGARSVVALVGGSAEVVRD